MHTTLIFAHTYFQQSKANRALLKALEHEKNISVRNLNALYPHYQIDVPSEVKALEESSKIILQFPLFWYSTPAMLKAWADEVLTPFYGKEDSPLKNKHAGFVVTVGGTKEAYEKDNLGEIPAMERFLFPQSLMLENVGAQVQKPLIFFGAMAGEKAVSVEEYLRYLKNV